MPDRSWLESSSVKIASGSPESDSGWVSRRATGVEQLRHAFRSCRVHFQHRKRRTDMNDQRAIRQYIEDWQRSGLDRLAVQMPTVVAEAVATPVAGTPAAPRVSQPPASPAATRPPLGQPPVQSPPVQTPSAATPAAHVQSQPPVAPVRPAPPQPLPTQSAPPIPPVSSQPVVPSEVDLPAPLASVIPAVMPPTPAGQKSTSSVFERMARLQVLAGGCAACTSCEELAASRTQTVFGMGNPQASIMFIGEAPGADEDRAGEPFVGPAGQLLDKIIGACKLKREQIYICNVLRCRPPGNRNPTPEEAANCRGFLDGQIAVVDPDYIVCWGGVAAQNLLGVTSPVGKLRGIAHQHGRAKVVCTFHPSYLLRNPAAKKDVWEDMKFLFDQMGESLD